MFLVTCGALACLKKTHYQAADHQGGEAPRGPVVLARVGPQIPTKHHNSVQPPRPTHLILVLLWSKTLSWSLLTERGCGICPVVSPQHRNPSNRGKPGFGA